MDSVSFLNSLLDKIDSSSNKDGGLSLHHTASATTSATHKSIAIKDHIMNKDNNSNVNMSNVKDNNTLHSAIPHRSDWFEYYDSASGKHYYHDRISNTTTWDKPEDFEKYFIHNRFTPITTNNTSSLTSSSSSSANKTVEVDYRVVGTFNKATGRFTNAGPESYWDKVS